MSSLEKLQKLETAEDVARLFGLTYKELSSIFYETSPQYKYFVYNVKKKSGKLRTISSPNRQIKKIQRILVQLLLEIYKPRPSVHGFCKDKSIVTNAKKHLDKRCILNIDLENFFDSIHFGRIRNLFRSHPLNIPTIPATILAHICCYNNRLPQGAPTSPVLTNMICFKMDKELQQFAKDCRATYSRYVDDLSFSFTCRKNHISTKILTATKKLELGYKLKEIITKHGFIINDEKVKFYCKNQRMQVTGIKINEFLNVSRNFINDIRSKLHAWEKYGYDNANIAYHTKYLSEKHIEAKKNPELRYVLRGKINYLKMVRGERDSLFIKYAKWFNKLIYDLGESNIKYIETSSDKDKLKKSIFIIEILYDDENGEVICYQGTGFLLEDFGLVTCAHVVSQNGEIFKEIYCYRHDDTYRKVLCKVENIDFSRDLAILKINDTTFLQDSDSIKYKFEDVKQQQIIKMIGYPAYKKGQTPYIIDGKIASMYVQKGISKFEISVQIREGNSGGPVLNVDNEVIGIAAEGAEKSGGNNAVIHIKELFALLESKVDEFQGEQDKIINASLS